MCSYPGDVDVYVSVPYVNGTAHLVIPSYHHLRSCGTISGCGVAYRASMPCYGRSQIEDIIPRPMVYSGGREYQVAGR